MIKGLITILFLGVYMTANANPLPNFDKLWDYSQPAETEKKFRALLPESIESKNKEYFLQLLTQIARTEGLQRKFDDAHRTLDEVQQKLDATTPIAEIRYFLEKGRVYNSSKKSDQALPLFSQAHELSTTRNQDNLAIDAAHMIAIAETGPEKQMEWNLKALAIAEKSTDSQARGWLGSLYNNIGWTYHDTGKYEEALALFKKALSFRESQGEPSTIRVAKWCLGRTYRSLKKYDSALEIQLALEKEFDQLPEKDGYVFEELGELYLSTSIPNLSKKYFAFAYGELSKDEWFKANESTRLQRIKELGGAQ